MLGTSYVYDYLDLFKSALNQVWSNSNASKPSNVYQSNELILDSEGNLKVCNRPIGSNDIGMVAWLMNLKTPEYPNGREIVVIANDITH